MTSWYEFLVDNGDGSFRVTRFASKRKAKDAFKFLTASGHYLGGEIEHISTDDEDFFETIENLRDIYSPL